jgi:hypothetical protein
MREKTQAMYGIVRVYKLKLQTAVILNVTLRNVLIKLSESRNHIYSPVTVSPLSLQHAQICFVISNQC